MLWTSFSTSTVEKRCGSDYLISGDSGNQQKCSLRLLLLLGKDAGEVLPLFTQDIQTLPCHLAPGTLNMAPWALTLRQKTNAHSGSTHRIFDLLVNQTLCRVVVGNQKGQPIPHCGSLEPQAGSLQASVYVKPSRLPSPLSRWPQGGLTVPKEDADSMGYFSAHGIFSIPSLYFIPLWGGGGSK